MKILQINTSLNTSPGPIAEGIGKLLISNGHESYIAFGRGKKSSESEKIKIGNAFDIASDVLFTRLLDRHGFVSKKATHELIKTIHKIKPDAIGLHNLHGYYLNVEILFSFLSRSKIPVLWTLHDCWAFTGHCAHFESVNCDKWKVECNNCPNIKKYPASYFYDNSRNNYRLKRKIFNQTDINFVLPSNWLKEKIESSFLSRHKCTVINNGIDLNIFKPQYVDRNCILEKNIISDKKIILGVASTWKKKKAFQDFLTLRNLLSKDFQIILIGLSKHNIIKLPAGIIGIERIESIYDLVNFYNFADVFVNPTYADTFPTVNIESIACGTPVITYNTGGSPEIIDKNTGLVVPRGNIDQLKEAIIYITEQGKINYTNNCVKRARLHYNKNDRFQDYIKLYEKLLVN